MGGKSSLDRLRLRASEVDGHYPGRNPLGLMGDQVSVERKNPRHESCREVKQRDNQIYTILHGRCHTKTGDVDTEQYTKEIGKDTT